MLRLFIFLLFAVTMGLSGAKGTLGATTPGESTNTQIESAVTHARVDEIVATDGSSLRLTFAVSEWNLTDKSEIVSVDDKSLKQLVAQLAAGDRIDVTTQGEKPKKLLSMSIASSKTSKGALLIFVVMGVLLVLMAGIMRDYPNKLLLGEDGLYSKSKTQMGFWFLSVISVYIAVVIARGWYLGGDFIGGVAIPDNLLILTGLSAFSFGAAKALTSKKTGGDLKPDQAQDPANPAVPKVRRKTASFLTDLVKNDFDQFDLGDTQMTLITIIVIVIFLWDSIVYLQHLSMRTQVTLPDVDTTLLSVFGLGQGAYLFKKAAGEAGKT